MRLLILTLALLFTIRLLAQNDILNGNFEDTTIVSLQQPGDYDTLINGWTQINGFGAGVTSDAYSGNLAAFVWNWYYYVEGELTNGNSIPPSQGGTPISFRPTAMTGYYKYIYGENGGESDSALAQIWLMKYNAQTAKRDTLGYGITKLGPISNYTSFNVPVNYNSSEQPDTVLVKFLSSEDGFCNSVSTNCLYFYFDDISLKDEATGIRQSIGFQEDITLFPNPAGDLLNFTLPNPGTSETISVAVYDQLGRKMFSKNIVPAITNQLEIGHLPPGVYLFKAGNITKEFVRQ